MAVPDLRSNSYYMNKLSASAQTNGRPHYDELARSCIPPAIVGDHSFADQQRLYYRQPYSVAMNSLNPPIPFPNHPPVDEPILPKFPPQMFDIPDIHDSNSVFNEGTFDVTGGGGGVSKPVTHHLPFESSVASPLPLQPPVCRTLMPFVGDWQPPSYISAAAAAAAAAASSTNSSSPLTHNEENKSYDVPMSQPLTQQQNVFSSSTVKAPVKKTKSPKKRKRKDPNEPQKPVSAYSLFFRNAQAAIKSQNPNATFGDISKIVASMWDNLDNEIKRFYKRQMETAKKEYLKQLAVYRASLTTQQESEGRSASGREESDQAQQQQQQQQTALAKASSSSSSSSSGPSSVSSSLLASHADESISQGPSVSEVQTPDHSAIQLHQRPPSVETAVHKLPISQHAMNQQQQSHQVYFKELVPTAGPSPLQNGVYGVQGNVAPPAMSQNMFLSYNTERPDYFGSGIGIVQNHYADSRYAAAGLWSHSSQSEDYTPKCRGWPPWPK